MRLGFEAVGGKCIYSSEWDPYAKKTYEANHRTSRTATSLRSKQPKFLIMMCWLQAFLANRFQSRAYPRLTHWVASMDFFTPLKERSSSMSPE